MNTPFVEIHSLDKSPLCTLYTLSVKLNGSAAIEIGSTKAISRQNDNTSIVFAFAWRAARNVRTSSGPVNIQCLRYIDQPTTPLEAILQMLVLLYLFL